MKNPILTIVMFLVLIINTFSQVEDRTITYNQGKYFLKGNYYLGGQVLRRSELKNILATNPASASEYHKYKVTRYVGVTTIIVGDVIALTGFARYINTAHFLNYEETQPVQGGVLIAVGVGMMVVGEIILETKPYFKRTIRLYNSSVKSVGSKPIRFDLTLNPYGLGMKMTF